MDFPEKRQRPGPLAELRCTLKTKNPNLLGSGFNKKRQQPELADDAAPIKKKRSEKSGFTKKKAATRGL